MNLRLYNGANKIYRGGINQDDRFQFGANTIPTPMNFTCSMITPMVSTGEQVSVLLRVTTTMGIYVSRISMVFRIRHNDLLCGPSNCTNVIFSISSVRGQYERRINQRRRREAIRRPRINISLPRQ